jgi:hypothetical protein
MLSVNKKANRRRLKSYAHILKMPYEKQDWRHSMPAARFTSLKSLEDLAAAAAAPIAICGESKIEATAATAATVVFPKFPEFLALTTFPDVDHVDQIDDQIGAQIEITEGVVTDVAAVT